MVLMIFCTYNEIKDILSVHFLGILSFKIHSVEGIYSSCTENMFWCTYKTNITAPLKAAIISKNSQENVVLWWLSHEKHLISLCLTFSTLNETIVGRWD